MVAVHDTLREVTTITVQQNEAGDTVKLVQVTDRTRASAQAAVKDKEVKVIVQTDTVVVEKRDSIRVQDLGFRVNGDQRQNRWAQSLKWVFWIIVGLIGLVIVVKIRGVP